MKLTADYHTHTKYSHGNGTVFENAYLGSKNGLKEIGISDHGFYHGAFGLSRKKIPNLVKDCKEAENRYGIKVKVGVESNIIGVNGNVDFTEKYYDNFDIFLVGIHKFVLFKLNSIFSMSFGNIILTGLKKKDYPNWLIKDNTKAIVNVIKNNPVDVITHPGFCAPINVLEVAKCASDYGTYLELNAKKTHLTDEEIDKVLSTNARFVISSDAHSPFRVGEISLVEKLISRTNFPLERIDNIEGRLPNFRFNKFKGEAGKWVLAIL